MCGKIISPSNLFMAWAEFKKGKQHRKDVMQFEYALEENIFKIHKELQNQTYKHGGYTDFYTTDPKQRHVHKALVRDRIIHHAVFNILNPIFEKTFIFNSYSCRKNKGTHKGVNQLQKITRKISGNGNKNCFVLKCDIKKFFQSVDHGVLLEIISKKISSAKTIALIKEIIYSFSAGIPIGNLTSQLFANIYLNEMDQYIKQSLKVPFYIRYTDDFVMVASNLQELKIWLQEIMEFADTKLKLKLHPNKIILRKYRQGVDFLGYIQFPHHRILRLKTKKRMLNKIQNGVSEQSLNSYLGVLSHADSHKLSQEIKNLFWFNKK